MFQRILVPLDGSALAEQALPVAARIARAGGGIITLLHVANVSTTAVSYGAMQPLITQDAIDISLEHGNAYLDGLTTSHQELAGVALDRQVIVGHPAIIILSVLDEQVFDLIVMSSHGHTGVKRWILGSVAEKVIHHAPTPVLVLREGASLKPSEQSEGGASHVRALVPLDTSERALDVILPAAVLVAACSAPGRGELHFTQVVSLPVEIHEREKEALFQEIERRLQEVCTRTAQALGSRLSPDLQPVLTWSISLESDVAAAIVKMAEHGAGAARGSAVEASDLIAMTTHGYTGFQRWTMGSVAERVLRGTKLPLLLTRPADMIDKERPRRQSRVETPV
ncbi:MAG TPA: universal stress protein [Ktedonobacteraceae bacterium]|nr:universal stress protein [Ktedonobacteraceae bacterium]